ncbi:hypothetical protein K474DRAFT_1680767 [Panus rudis PR-1116 ss-1]|nr:hypothetical protein K474DRAFT_1680767 [Panus rudis PR-1116 ss-1]
MSDFEAPAPSKKRSHPHSESEDVSDQPGPLLETRNDGRPTRKKQKLHKEPCRPFVSENSILNVRVKAATQQNRKCHSTNTPVHATSVQPSSASDSIEPETEMTFPDKHAQNHIKNELGTRQGAIVHDYPVVDFIRNVWGFRPESIPHGTTSYVLVGELVESYEQSEYAKTKKYSSGERNSCLAFEKIFQKLVEQIEINNMEADSPLLANEFEGELRFLRELVFDWDSVDFRPDYAFVKKGSLKGRQFHWHQVGAVGDQKNKSARSNSRFRKNVTINPRKLLVGNCALNANNIAR